MSKLQEVTSDSTKEDELVPSFPPCWYEPLIMAKQRAHAENNYIHPNQLGDPIIQAWEEWESETIEYKRMVMKLGAGYLDHCSTIEK